MISMDDYIIPDDQEQDIMDRIKNGSAADKAALTRELMMLREKNRGIYLKGKGKGYHIEPEEFSRYVVLRFSIINVNGRIAFRNNSRHVYEFLREEMIRKLFHQVLLEYDDNIWNSRTENEYMKNYTFYVQDINAEDIDEDHMIFQNGVLNLKDYSFSNNFDKDIYTFHSYEYDYDLNAKCVNFENYLKNTFNGDKEVIDVVQEIVGYTFCTGATPIHKLFLFIGEGRNGKSVLTNVIHKLHYPNTSAEYLDDLIEKFAIASCYDKAVNISPEREQRKVFDTARIKGLTAGDVFQIERKYENSFTARVKCKFIVNCNQVINTNDATVAFSERLLPIRFPNVFYELRKGEKPVDGKFYQDKNLEDKLNAELSGIFIWALEGYKRLRNNNWQFSYSKQIEMDKQWYQLHSNPVKHFFISCVDKDDLKLTYNAHQLYKNYEVWLEQNDIDPGVFNTSAKFHEAARNCLSDLHRSSETVKVRGTTCYKGISMKFNWKNSISAI